MATVKRFHAVVSEAANFATIPECKAEVDEVLMFVEQVENMGVDYLEKLSLEVICHILGYLPLRDVLKLDHLKKKLHEAVSMHLRVCKAIDFTEGQLYAYLTGSLTDVSLSHLLSRCSELRYIYGFHPVSISKRRTRGSKQLSIPGVIDALSLITDLRGIEISSIFLLEAILTYLPQVEVLGTFKNRDRAIPIPPMNRIVLPVNPRITSLNLKGVVLPELPRMDFVKHIHLHWVKLNQHPFKDFGAPMLQTFVMSNCAGPTNALKYVPLMTGLAAARSLTRLVLIRVPFLGGLIQHLVEDSWRMGGFRGLQAITLGACKHALEVDLGFLAMTCAFRLEELSIQPSLTKDSFFSALNMAESIFPHLDSLVLGFVDSFPESGKWTNEELMLHGLADITENPAMITDIGMKAAGEVFHTVRRLEIYNCPHLHYPTTWFIQAPGSWCRLRELTLRRCHAIRLPDFSRFITMLPVLESLHLEAMFSEPPKGCARVGLSAGTGLGVSSALVSNTSNEPGNNDDGIPDDEDDPIPVNNNNDGEPAIRDSQNNSGEATNGDEDDIGARAGPSNESRGDSSKPGSSNQAAGDPMDINGQERKEIPNDGSDGSNDGSPNCSSSSAQLPAEDDQGQSSISGLIQNDSNSTTEQSQGTSSSLCAEETNVKPPGATRNEQNPATTQKTDQKECDDVPTASTPSKSDVCSTPAGTTTEPGCSCVVCKPEGSPVQQLGVYLTKPNGTPLEGQGPPRTTFQGLGAHSRPNKPLCVNLPQPAPNSMGTDPWTCNPTEMWDRNAAISARPEHPMTADKNQNQDSMPKGSSSVCADATTFATNCTSSGTNSTPLNTNYQQQVSSTTSNTNFTPSSSHSSPLETNFRPSQSTSIPTYLDSNCMLNIVSKPDTCHLEPKNCVDLQPTQTTSLQQPMMSTSQRMHASQTNPNSQQKELMVMQQRQNASSAKAVNKGRVPRASAEPSMIRMADSTEGFEFPTTSSSTSSTLVDRRDEENGPPKRKCRKTEDKTHIESKGDLSPDEAVLDGSPFAAVIDGSPVKDVVDGSPVEAVMDESPVESVMDESPVEDVVDRSPVEAVMDKSPVEAVLDGSPVEAVMDESPVEDVVDRSPVEAVMDESPVKAVMDGSPVETVMDGPSIEDVMGGSLVEAVIDVPAVASSSSQGPHKIIHSSSSSSSAGVSQLHEEYRRSAVKGKSKYKGKGKGKGKRSEDKVLKDLEQCFEISQENEKPASACLKQMSDETFDTGGMGIDFDMDSTSSSWSFTEGLVSCTPEPEKLCPGSWDGCKDDGVGPFASVQETQGQNLPAGQSSCILAKNEADLQRAENQPPYDNEIVEPVKKVTISGDTCSAFVLTESEFEAQSGNSSIMIENGTLKLSKEGSLDCTVKSSGSSQNFEQGQSSQTSGYDLSEFNSSPQPKSPSSTRINDLPKGRNSQLTNCGSSTSKVNKGKSLKGKKRSFVKHSSGKVSQSCQAVSEEIRETTKKAKENEDMGRSPSTRRASSIYFGTSSSTSMDKPTVGKGDDGINGTNLVSGQPAPSQCSQTVKRPLRKPNTCDQATSTSDPVIEDDHVQVLTIRSRSLVTLTLHCVGVTDVFLQDCPSLATIQGTSCRVLKKININRAPKLSRVTFAQCKKLDERHLVTEVCKQPSCESRTIFIRPLKELHMEPLERYLFRTSGLDYHMCLVKDNSPTPASTMYNRTRVGDWNDLLHRISYDLTYPPWDFPLANGKRNRQGNTRYPWGRRIYNMQGRNADDSTWDLMTDIPWLRLLSECPDISSSDVRGSNLSAADHKEGLYCRKAKGHKTITDVMKMISEQVVELREAKVPLYHQSVIVYINTSDMNGMPTPDMYF